MMYALSFIFGAVTACALIAFGWNGEGILHQLALIFGGLNFGHILTEALNYNEEK
jgi:hypothetical protein